MECPDCSRNIALTCSVCCCDSFLQFNRINNKRGNFRYYLVKCNKCLRDHHKEVANQEGSCRRLKAVAEAASNQLSFLKLQALDPSTESDVLNGYVILSVEDCTSDGIRAHRFILAERSPVFRRMFESEMTERKTGVITIDDACYATMQAVVRFCYTAEVNFTEDIRADEILRVAHKYQILHLRDLCAKELVKGISKENMIEMLKLSRDCEAKQLYEAAGQYLEEHCRELFPVIVQALFT